MPDAVETAVFANEAAWHGLGVVLDTDGAKGITVEQAIESADLDWGVEKAPSLTLSLDKQVKDYEEFMKRVKAGATLKYSDLVWVHDNFAVQRQSDGSGLGVVGNTWQPVQNREGFAVLQDVIEQAGGQCWIEAAGSLEHGRRVWVLAHVDTDLMIAGEKYFSYILFLNHHNGRGGTTAMLTDVRAVCANTVAMALGQARREETFISVRHTVNAAERIKQASHIWHMRNVRAEELAQQGEWLVAHEVDEGEFNNFLETLMPLAEEQEGKPAGTMIENRREKVRHVYMQAPNLEPIRGTWWGAVQAVAEYCDHRREFKTPETQLKAQWGLTPQPLKQQAYDLACAFAAA